VFVCTCPLKRVLQQRWMFSSEMWIRHYWMTLDADYIWILIYYLPEERIPGLQNWLFQLIYIHVYKYHSSYPSTICNVSNKQIWSLLLLDSCSWPLEHCPAGKFNLFIHISQWMQQAPGSFLFSLPFSFPLFILFLSF
jgi:hypothetical protein